MKQVYWNVIILLNQDRHSSRKMAAEVTIKAEPKKRQPWSTGWLMQKSYDNLAEALDALGKLFDKYGIRTEFESAVSEP